MRNWEKEQVIKKHILGCYVSPEIKTRVKELAKVKRVSISQLTREMIEFALVRFEAEQKRSVSP